MDLVHSDTELIIFIRLDLIPIDKFYYKNYLKQRDAILTPNWGKWGGHNDRFAIIPVSSASLYSNRFNRLDEYIKSHQELQAERFLHWTLRDCTPKEIVNERMLRVRAGGFVDTNENFYIPRKYDRSKPLIESIIYKQIDKMVNYKRRYIARPFF